jgi:hypothetical protein
MRLARPLVSPYFHIAGGLEVSFNHSENVYNKPDTFFYKYSYNLSDVWIGYNFGIGKGKSYEDRSRKFFAIRYLQNRFTNLPWQVGEKFDPIYNNKQAVLAELTLFRQNYYSTNYIYGFGTTEDVPYGYNISVTGGWYKQRNFERPYAGFSANRFVTTARGKYMQYFLRTGSLLNKKNLQDASVLIGGSMFSQLFLYKNLKIREYIKLSYTRLFNRITYEPLRIDNPFGVRYYKSDSVAGDERLSLYAETFVFTKPKVFGFKLAPFVFADLSYLTPEDKQVFKSGFYSGLGGGIRTRNENLVFGTIELRFIYFPKIVQGMNYFRILIQSHLRFRYNSNYVKAPGLLQLNTDDSVNGF